MCYCHLLDDLGADLPEFTGLYRILNNNGLLKSEFINDFINQYKTRDLLRSEVTELNDELTDLYDRKLAL